MDLVPNPENSNSDNTSGSGPHLSVTVDASSSSTPHPLDRYESQKRRDWNTFSKYLENHRPPLCLTLCSGAHVLEFLRYVDQFGKTKVHTRVCPFFGSPVPPAPCRCPLRQAWGSLDACVGRLRAAYEENGGKPENNPFGASAVMLYLQEVRLHQAKSRGIRRMHKKRLTRDQTAPPGLININPFGAGAVKVSKDIKYADKEPNSDNTSGSGPHLSVTVAASSSSTPPLSRYESRKHRDWNIFSQYLENHKPPLSLALCSGAHVLEFLRYLDQFVKTKVHTPVCPFFGHPVPPAPFLCPLCTLDACVGRLRAAYEENGGKPENNPFGTSAVMLYLQDVKKHQAEARGISYEKRKPKKLPTSDQTPPHCLININPFGTGTVKMWKDIKYADKEPIVPWGPRYSRCTLKDMCINMAISAVFTAWIFITRSSQWRPMLFMAFAFFYRIFQKLKAFEPNVAPTYNIYGEDEKKGMGMGKRMLRSLGLVFGCIAVTSLGYTGILILIVTFSKYVPLFVYNNQELFVTTASSVLLYIMASYYR